ncbi:MAG: EAL domain-containing protein [Pseudomonadota bacterium]
MDHTVTPLPFEDDFALARALGTPLWVFDIDRSRVIHANAAACTLWQAGNEEELRARRLDEGMTPAVFRRLKQYQADFENGAEFNELWTLYPRGEPVTVSIRFTGFRLTDGRMAMLCEAGTSDEKTPENLRSAEALLHTDVMISLFEEHGSALYMNPAARNAAFRSSYTLPELFVDINKYEELVTGLARSSEYSLVAQVHTIAGTRWHNLSAKACFDAVTGVSAILVTCNDVSDLKNARDEANFLAQRDQLTGCFNRGSLVQRVSDLAAYNPMLAAMLFFDVDRFKQINDRFGHEVGDFVLRKLVARARSVIRKSDILCRLGGDEFVILFEDVKRGEVFEREIGRILQILCKPLQHGATTLQSSVSMGLTYFTPGEQDFNAILSEADIALYASKAEGRGRLTVFNEALGTAARERDRLEADLKMALESSHFVLHYQPRVSLESGRIVSAEALVRWDHPERGLVMPDVFIGVCEDTGMIQQLGHQVLEMAFEQLASWIDNGADIKLSVNISPRQLEDPALVPQLRSCVERTGVTPESIELEITENTLISDPGAVSKKLEEIKSMGFRIAIDDFGTGYSSLSYISQFPVDSIKIDRRFVAGLPDSGPVARLILILAREIGATTIAEGVERPEERAWLEREGCDQIQGFLFSRPKPAAELSIDFSNKVEGPR